ncbi:MULTISPECIES: hypothetical protein [unclassified Beijerinckia]|uniref:hypothetical protein n=1 Tax=unclassified Beijerinckia TaxID=2638183 RepID=UPI000898C717|nr:MULTISPECIES: hypothetical protein [unclassified Beijerinckia]MDH7796491.1 hypothetical protein [Beijerinckia sp. GAS462]SEC47371.1 hypothetical protein SAMN05443249_2775 [Beijerinckia sp. 28-YEA-48]
MRLRVLSFILVMAVAGSAMAAPFDGSWSFDVSTEVGDCEPVRQYPVTIADSRMASGAGSPAATVGTIEANGSVWGRFSSAGDVVRIQGRLSKGTGSGTWSSGSRYCGGQWRAHKG